LVIVREGIIIIEIPFIPGILMLLIIFIVTIRVYIIISSYIGEQIRLFFVSLWQRIKK